MKVVLKYLKPFAFILLLCVILLFGQALSDLSLPDLMSDIVNVGLQKNGVDEPVPEKISEQGMALVCLLMREEDREIFQSGYEKKDGIYVLSSDRVEQKTQEVYESSKIFRISKRSAPQRKRCGFIRNRRRNVISNAAFFTEYTTADGG